MEPPGKRHCTTARAVSKAYRVKSSDPTYMIFSCCPIAPRNAPCVLYRNASWLPSLPDTNVRKVPSVALRARNSVVTRGVRSKRWPTKTRVQSRTGFSESAVKGRMISLLALAWIPSRSRISR